ncbi:hypothetical protein P615_18045 [Brevibacillus laterosporus PE36]|nr:hypothetical protein P615_18045 [Brevibacillus laterosporus PE36]
MNEIYMQMWTSLANYDTNRPFQFWLTRLGNPSSAEISGQELEEIPNF